MESGCMQKSLVRPQFRPESDFSRYEDELFSFRGTLGKILK
ncbi:hypothetical protein ACPOL_1973 [Acidisarcina polymorpha]|uniref:Uncharacterized protein n=1 Tax=Acidisarcina polymorpha TaxID=2211140 RepID=A0A2Z5FWP5_9BACT|nr:hypothetical protein ACPOL_1973 [Acidisarcina polymorpha]